jgi:hypothetical protein
MSLFIGLGRKGGSRGLYGLRAARPMRFRQPVAHVFRAPGARLAWRSAHGSVQQAHAATAGRGQADFRLGVGVSHRIGVHFIVRD